MNNYGGKEININTIKTVIMAGGIGSRIQSIESELPKPLIKIGSKPILQWEIECLVSQGFKDIILTVSYKAEMIMDYFGNGSKFNANISYYKETTPLGNAGALFKLWETGQLGRNEDFLLLNADSMFDVDFHRFLDFHRGRDAVASLFTHPNSHPYDSGLIITDSGNRVEAWLNKEYDRPEVYQNRVNAGLHILNTRIFETTDIDASLIGTADINTGKTYKVDLDRQLLKPLAGSGYLYAYESPEYVKDMGTPERFEQVSKDLMSGLVGSRNLSHPQRAIFLDRDGTINRFVGFLRDIDNFELLPRVAEAIKLINDSGYLCIVVTNQPVIARGEVTEEELRQIHNKMETELGKAGAYVDAIYYCPHHPDKGFEGERPEYKIDCECRKPKPGMLLAAARDYNINLADSWIIGDSWRDVECGINAGTRTVLISSEENKGDEAGCADKCTPDFVASDLLGAVERILEHWDYTPIRY